MGVIAWRARARHLPRELRRLAAHERGVALAIDAELKLDSSRGGSTVRRANTEARKLSRLDEAARLERAADTLDWTFRSRKAWWRRG